MSVLFHILLLAQGIGLATNDCRGHWMVRWTNAPACLVVEGSADLAEWFPLFQVSRWDGERWNHFEYDLRTDGPMTFYRLRQSECCGP